MNRCSIHLICERGGYQEKSPKVRKSTLQFWEMVVHASSLQGWVRVVIPMRMQNLLSSRSHISLTHAIVPFILHIPFLFLIIEIACFVWTKNEAESCTQTLRGGGILSKDEAGEWTDGLQLQEVAVEGAKDAPALFPSPHACSGPCSLQDPVINLGRLCSGSAFPSGLREAKYSQRVSHLGGVHRLTSQIHPHSTCSMELLSMLWMRALSMCPLK